MYTGLKEYFEIMKWDVTTVREEGIEGVDDKEIVEYVKENNMLLVTQDQKPAELAKIEDIPYVYISKRLIAELIDSKINDKYKNE